MESSTFHTEGKKHNVGVDMDVEVIKLKRQQKHLLTAVAALLLLSLFCVAMVIWLSVEVTEDNDDDGGTVRVNDGKSEVPATDRASTLNVWVISHFSCDATMGSWRSRKMHVW